MDYTTYILNSSNFDIAVQVFNNNEDYLAEDYDLYVNLGLRQTINSWNLATGSWDTTIIQSTLIICTENRFMNDTVFMNMGYADIFLCPENVNYTIMGNPAGMEYHGIEAYVTKCN